MAGRRQILETNVVKVYSWHGHSNEKTIRPAFKIHAITRARVHTLHI